MPSNKSFLIILSIIFLIFNLIILKNGFIIKSFIPSVICILIFFTKPNLIYLFKCFFYGFTKKIFKLFEKPIIILAFAILILFSLIFKLFNYDPLGIREEKKSKWVNKNKKFRNLEDFKKEY